MDKLIYVAMTAAKHVMHRQDNLAHNLAHSSTPGFRAETLAFHTVASEAISPTQKFVIESTTGADLTPGSVQRTGRALDVAIDGPGWIALQGRNGREAYTRNGALEVGADGVLKVAGGPPVVGQSGPIVVPPDAALTIARDGVISAVPNGQSVNAVQVLGRLKLVNPPGEELVRGDDGMFRTRNERPAPVDDRVRLVPQAIESSNVNTVDSMVGMIGAARQFEMQMKLLQTAEANARSAAPLLQVGN